ncbi:MULTISPECIES: TonB-dependent receptor plug domain-containing protein [Prevotellaceae]|uniref:TonB-dependent receptor plug domain-containing protein n=1 Tax=Prevotellaceae TaxID=171552 RepID=UPI0003D3A5CF|nr:TonB-dependent receptor plug domain-containing protein [Prevotella phocaeensis]ETD17728.1 hypothetical protein HMPREF1199_01786 [Hoylesella oralis CC98A]
MIKNKVVRMGLLALMVLTFSVLKAQNKDSLNIKEPQYIQEVVVQGSQVNRINSSAFNAVAVDLRRLRNTNLDIAHVLDRVSGVKVREDGGLGSAVNINLNGFTGKHVRLFIDGVPMQGVSSSFGINNIPLGLAQRIEVYKGVVPVEFGGDALGGAINIVTDRRGGTYVDASYSYGSFNTHRTNLAFGSTFRNGLTVKVNAYQNFSDNDYKVKVRNTNLETMQVDSEERWFRRFHDRYHNEAGILQIGVVNRSWADRLMLGLAYSHEYAQIQNANIMTIVFGGKLRKAQGWAPSLMYEKRNFFVQNLDLRLSARYDAVLTNNIDTLSRTYNWEGRYVANAYQGEGQATLAEFRGNTLSLVGALKYRIGDKHFFSLNNTFTDYRRHTTNNAANAVQQTAATFMRRVNVKEIFGASYKFMPAEQWNVTAFLKYYNSHVRGPVNIGSRRYEEQQRSVNALGYGMAGTYFVNRDWQLKLSYEKTFRLPTDRELFGDGDYERGDSRLRPEMSHNVNLNLGYQHTFSDVSTLQFDAAFNYRRIEDYIIRIIGSTGTAMSSNHGKVIGLGMDLSVRYAYRDALAVGGNFSLQSMRDRERLTAIGSASVTYNNRVPNLPYSFANADVSYTFRDVLGTGNRLTFGYDMRYVHRFYRSWEGSGAKLYIPEQFSHNANATYSVKQGRYNVSLEVNNFTDRLLYDNYSLQKPGRNFSIKLRYMFYKQR